jgi:hypothetical protein
MAHQLATIKPCGGGVNKDLLPSELAPEQWSDALNMRFVNDMAIRRGGFREVYTDPTVIPYALTTYVIPPDDRFIVRAGIGKVHADDGSTVTEITRYTDGIEIASITFVGTTATVTTVSNHGRSNGHVISVFGALPSPYNVESVAITVTGLTTFTYTMGSIPATNATTVGQYEYNVQDDFNGAVDDRATLFSFNGILIYNNPVDGPYYWNGDVTKRLRRLPGWIGKTAYAMYAFKNFLVAMAPTISSVFYPHKVMWSTSAETGSIPTSWTATSTNDAGDTPQAAEAAGQLVDGRPWDDSFILYKLDSRFALDYIGGTDVLRLRRLPGNDGLMARTCVVETPRGQVFLANGDVRMHNGGASVSIAEGKVREWLQDTMDTSFAQRSFLCLNPPKCEVWVVYCRYGQTVPDTVLAWNWNHETWAIYTIPPATCAATGLIVGGLAGPWDTLPGSWDEWDGPWSRDDYSPNQQRLIMGHSALSLSLADTGTTDLGTAIEWRLEKRGTTFGDVERMKMLVASWPQVSTADGVEFSVYHTTTMDQDDAPVYPTAVTYVKGTTKWANRFSNQGHFLSYKLEGSDGPGVAMRSYQVKFAYGGEH